MLNQSCNTALDKYGFKASFFEVCTWIGKTKERQTWQDITALERDGMDIESHTMTHAHLPRLLSSTWQLNYEIGGSKQCLANHGINATIFGYPLNLASDNPKIVNVVAKYYNLARSGSAPLMFLNCKGYAKDTQTDCRTLFSQWFLLNKMVSIKLHITILQTACRTTTTWLPR
jgi:hypothetical protein